MALSRLSVLFGAGVASGWSAVAARCCAPPVGGTPSLLRVWAGGCALFSLSLRLAEGFFPHAFVVFFAEPYPGRHLPPGLSPGAPPPFGFEDCLDGREAFAPHSVLASPFVLTAWLRVICFVVCWGCCLLWLFGVSRGWPAGHASWPLGGRVTLRLRWCRVVRRLVLRLLLLRLGLVVPRGCVGSRAMGGCGCSGAGCVLWCATAAAAWVACWPGFWSGLPLACVLLPCCAGGGLVAPPGIALAGYVPGRRCRLLSLGGAGRRGGVFAATVACIG
eukprot:s1286_g8.t1